MLRVIHIEDCLSVACAVWLVGQGTACCRPRRGWDRPDTGRCPVNGQRHARQTAPLSSVTSRVVSGVKKLLFFFKQLFMIILYNSF